VYLKDRFCVSRIGRTEGSGWVHLKGENSVAVSGFTCEKEKPLVGAKCGPFPSF